jgi:hypothetical protein
MFGLTKYQLLEIVILLVIAYHVRKMYEKADPNAYQLLNMNAQ